MPTASPYRIEMSIKRKIVLLYSLAGDRSKAFSTELISVKRPLRKRNVRLIEYMVNVFCLLKD